MSGMAGGIGQVSANTEFLNIASEIFNKRPGGPWSMLAKSVPLDGQSLELDAIGPSPAVRKMLGSRRFTSLRAYAQRTPAVVYSADALEFARLKVLNDKSGALRARLADYLAATADFFEKPVIDLLLTNPLGIDATALFSATHPYGPSAGTWDNLTSGGLDQTELEGGIVAMRGLRFENGEPAGFFPTDLIVGPALEREALDLTGADRMMPVSNAGAPDATSSVVAAIGMKNWIGGRLGVTVVDRFADGTHDSDWVLADLSKPNIRPIVIGEAIAPAGVVVDDPQSEPMVQRESYQYYVSGTAAIAGYAPQTVYGKMT